MSSMSSVFHAINLTCYVHSLHRLTREHVVAVVVHLDTFSMRADAHHEHIGKWISHTHAVTKHNRELSFSDEQELK